MRAETLILTGLLLLRFGRGELDPKIISFSRGVQLFVKGIYVEAPKLQILLPAGLWMETSDADIFTCIITGLHTAQIRVTWKINKTTVTERHTTVDIFKEPDGTYTALGHFYPSPGHKLTTEEVYRCEVEQAGMIYYEEVWPSLCD